MTIATITMSNPPRARVLTEYDPKPIPLRQFDWSAAREDYEPGMALGFGATKAAAIADLLEQESDE